MKTGKSLLIVAMAIPMAMASGVVLAQTTNQAISKAAASAKEQQKNVVTKTVPQPAAPKQGPKTVGGGGTKPRGTGSG